MMSPQIAKGRAEYRKAFWSARGLFIVAGIFSCFVNLLMLTGPMFMLQVYDRVLASGSQETLMVLFALVAGLFAIMGILDFLRGRILANAGARFQAILDGRVFDGVMQRALAPSERAKPAAALRDLESIQQFLSGSAPFAFFDAPWVPIYLGAIFMFHPLLGAFALAAAILLFFIALLNQIMTKEPEMEARMASAQSEKFSESMRRDAETVRALGMGSAARGRWGEMRGKALGAQMQHSTRAGFFQTFAKTFRMFLQSAILAVGAWLAVKQEISPGMMIAASILMGRALAPVDQAIANWRVFVRARHGARALQEFFAVTPQNEAKTTLPDPKAKLEVSGLAVAPPGERTPIIRGVSFAVEPGEAIGVIGPSASGKSTLARALIGVWQPMIGEVRFDGATLDQWGITGLGQRIGYLPQDVGLFAGTIAQNIARLSPDMDEGEVVKAAQRAGAHRMIVGLANGYDTEIGEGGGQLSGGQRQRVGLARALYGDPPLLIFDEPNANLDAEGEATLVQAIRDAKERGCAIIVMAHRPSAIAACDKLLVMKDGQQQAFGPRDEILRQTTSNHGQQVTPINRAAVGNLT